MEGLGTEVSSEGQAASEIAECPQKEEHPQEQLSVLGRKSDFGKVLRLSSWARNESVGTSSMSLIRDAPDEVEHVSRS